MSTCDQNAVGSSSKKEEEDLCSWLQRSFCSSYGALGFFAFHVAGGLIHALINTSGDRIHLSPAQRATKARLTGRRDSPGKIRAVRFWMC